jgi:hypothetical protein
VLELQSAVVAAGAQQIVLTFYTLAEMADLVRDLLVVRVVQQVVLINTAVAVVVVLGGTLLALQVPLATLVVTVALGALAVVVVAVVDFAQATQLTVALVVTAELAQ